MPLTDILAEIPAGLYVLTANGELGIYDAQRQLHIDEPLTRECAERSREFLRTQLQDPLAGKHRIAILFNGDLQEQGRVDKLIEDSNRLELRATGVQMNDALKRELEAVIKKHGGSLETFGHPTTTLEDLFLRIVEESRLRPGRRYMEPVQAGETAKP